MEAMAGETSKNESLAALQQWREEADGRVAKSLHDNVGQVLTAVGLHLDVLRLEFGPLDPSLPERLREVQQLLERAMDTIRDLSYEIHPDIVRKAGLTEALRRLTRRWPQPGPIAIDARPPQNLPVEISEAFYRVAECALQPGMRSPDTTQTAVRIEQLGNGARLTIEDDGAGVDGDGEVAQRALAVMKHWTKAQGVRVRWWPERHSLVEAVWSGKPRRRVAEKGIGPA